MNQNKVFKIIQSFIEIVIIFKFKLKKVIEYPCLQWMIIYK